MQIVSFNIYIYIIHTRKQIFLYFPGQSGELWLTLTTHRDGGGRAVSSQQGTEKQDEITAFDVPRQGRGQRLAEDYLHALTPASQRRGADKTYFVAEAILGNHVNQQDVLGTWNEA